MAHSHPIPHQHPHTEIAFAENHSGLQVANNFGHVNIAPERPETPPRPSSDVPFPRDPDFVERPALTEQISARLSAPAGRAALAGLGGVGKSQLAIEYARRLRQQSPDTWVFWIHASNAGRFEESIRDVADQLKLRGRKDPKTDLLPLLRSWLRDQSKGQWLVVLDNADNAGFLLQPPASSEARSARRRIDYIPSCEHGAVLITTRDKREALKLVHEKETIDVRPMSEAEAEMLLETKLGQSSPENRRLAQALDCMPLAITQAAAYIQERGLRCSVQHYRKEIEQSRASRTGLLRRQVPLANRDEKARDSVLLTWQISFDHIYETRRSAADLLSLMSFCDRLAIPELLLQAGRGQSESLDGTHDFEEDIIVLRSFSFISSTTDAETWEMHRLVQDATQVWLQDHKRFDVVLRKLVRCLYKSFPSGELGTWSVCRALFPHAKSIAMHKPTNKEALLEWASVMHRSARFKREQGEYDTALAMARSSMIARSEQLGRDDKRTLTSMNTVATTYWEQGRWQEAEELEVKALETRRRILGPDHPDTLSSMDNLAFIYSSQGRWQEAEELQVEVLETSRGVLGPDHPDALIAKNNLALTYSKQGR